MNQERQFVLFPIGDKRFALPAAQVTELARPDLLQSFPHTTPLHTGVLVRRNHVVPVFDVAQVLVGPDAPVRKFYLIATRKIGHSEEWTAIPVTGECELKRMEMRAKTANLPEYVTGLLSLEDEIVQVIDLDTVAEAEAA